MNLVELLKRHPVGRARDLLGDEKWRRRRTAIPLVMTRIIAPDQNVVHDVTIDAFEEDFFLLENDMAVMKFASYRARFSVD